MGNDLTVDVLAVAAHPDDVEITCGGLLLKMVDLGRRTGVLDLTRGEMGTHGDETDRAREATAAGEALGLSVRENLGLPDSAVTNDQPSRLKLAEVIRRLRPELIILPHWKQRHPDHRICSQLGFDACFIAGLKKAQLEGEPFRPRKIIYVSYYRNLDYSFLVDISDQFKRKLMAVAAYESQFGDSDAVARAVASSADLHDLDHDGKDVFHPGIGIFDLMQVRSRQLGQMVGAKYAEAYTVREQMLVDDPLVLPVSSI